MIRNVLVIDGPAKGKEYTLKEDCFISTSMKSAGVFWLNDAMPEPRFVDTRYKVKKIRFQIGPYHLFTGHVAESESKGWLKIPDGSVLYGVLSPVPQPDFLTNFSGWMAWLKFFTNCPYDEDTRIASMNYMEAVSKSWQRRIKFELPSMHDAWELRQYEVGRISQGPLPKLGRIPA